MPAWLDSIMSPLNAAGEGIQKLIETRDLVKFGDTFRKLLAEILSAQQGALAAQTREATLLQRIGDLEQQIHSFETWNAEKDRYELKALAGGNFALMLKPNERGSEPPHWACQTCYENRKKSIFQWTPETAMARRVYRCPACKNTIAPVSDVKWLD